MGIEKSTFIKFFHNNGRALGSMGYFIILMLIFLIGAPEAWLRPNLHQSVFVMMPTLLFLVVPLVFLVASGEIDLSFASTYALAAYIFAILVKAGIAFVPKQFKSDFELQRFIKAKITFIKKIQ